jgi:hypothetical protein
MEARLKVNSKLTTSKDLGRTFGQMGGSMSGHGTRTKCMARENSVGRMEGSMLETTIWTRSRDLVRSSGQMDGDTKVSGLMGNKTEPGCLFPKQGRRRKACG